MERAHRPRVEIEHEERARARNRMGDGYMERLEGNVQMLVALEGFGHVDLQFEDADAVALLQRRACAFGQFALASASALDLVVPSAGAGA